MTIFEVVLVAVGVGTGVVFFPMLMCLWVQLNIEAADWAYKTYKEWQHQRYMRGK